ncbi:hypothetical protein J8J27_34110, partial [Mycobacterium tuberculosis]|nr:hypothetical protein [Mycobacterium tuberculosis]
MTAQTASLATDPQLPKKPSVAPPKKDVKTTTPQKPAAPLPPKPVAAKPAADAKKPVAVAKGPGDIAQKISPAARR